MNEAKERMKAIITIPCYNESKRLSIGNFLEFIESNEEIDFIFVNDGSKDDTLSLIGELEKEKHDRVKVLNFDVNQGKAEAVRRGILLSLSFKPDIVGFWDADLATPLSAIIEFIKVYDQEPKIEWVFGARVKLLGRKIKRTEIRHYFGRIFATLTSIILKLPIYDTQCGAKLFRNNVLLEEVFHKKFTSRWIFDVEIIARMIKAIGNKKVEEIIFEYPLYRWEDVHGSKLKYYDFLIATRELLKIWLYLKNTSMHSKF